MQVHCTCTINFVLFVHTKMISLLHNIMCHPLSALLASYTLIIKVILNNTVGMGF